MKNRPQALAPLLIVFLLVFTSAAAQEATAPPPWEIGYTVSMSRPTTHLLEVEMRVGGGRANLPRTLDLVMPVWTPGSYLVREFARHVQDFNAGVADGGGGRSLAWRKINKNTWRVDLPADARGVRVTYRVYANELTVRTNELNDRHAFWNNAALLMYPEGALRAPSTLRVVPYANWKVATGLPAVPNQSDTFRAENYDVLYDSPFEVGNFENIEFTVRGVPHRIVVEGTGNYESDRLRRDFAKIVEAAVKMMGEIPYRDYTFILNLRPGGGGGLEHLNSTALIASPVAFRNPTSYRQFLTLVAHEFFHLWNVKRLRPDALGPFDYTKENYTRLLWMAEGGTSYYEEMLLRRAGIGTDRDVLAALAATMQKIDNTPGRLDMSLEEASFDAWIKYYRPDENAINSQVSYYDKGALVAMLLDLEIRRRSDGARSLDDVIRALDAEFYKKNRNYTPEDLQQLAERFAGASLDAFFSSYVRGRAELDYDAAFAPFGLRLDRGENSPAATVAFLSDDLRQDADRLIVPRVTEGTPAYEQGLSAGDQIVALDGMRVTRETLLARLAEKKPGDVIRLTVFRFDELRTLEIRLGKRATGAYRLLPVEKPTAAQQRLYGSWMSQTVTDQ